jgi:predicted 3-demethylubiquinone-9 3-methyltransferase (glyoxalase superfamily)
MATSAHTHLMFQNGKALDAIRRYEEVFAGGFTADEVDLYAEGAPGPTGQVQLAVCTLAGQRVTFFDSPVAHGFEMTPSISLWVECDDSAELERLFDALAEGGQVFMPLGDYGFSTRYGWLADRFGVPWQLNLT